MLLLLCGAVLRLRGLRGLHVGCLHAVRAHLRALCLAMQLKASFFIYLFCLHSFKNQNLARCSDFVSNV